MKAVEILNDAAAMVDGPRAEQHGDMQTNFTNIARLWSAYLGQSLSETDAAMMLALMKIARTKSGTVNEDDYTDACGYIGIAAQVRDS